MHLYRVVGGAATLYQTLVPAATPAVKAGDYYAGGLTIGDVTNDGYSDLVVGAPLRDVSGAVDSGEVLVHVGGQGLTAPFALNATPLSLVPAVPVAKHSIGHSVSIGDIDGSGLADVVALAPAYPMAKGEVFTGHVVNNESSDPTWNFTPRLGLERGWGTTRPGIGDLNSDGRQDLVVGAPDVSSSAGCTELGMVYVFLAKQTGGWTRLTIQAPGETDDTQLGYSVAVANGYPFVLVGDNFRNIGGTVSAGQAFVYRLLP